MVGKWRSILAVFAALSLSGCSVTQSLGITAAAAAPSPKADLRVARVLATEGLEKLRQHRYEDASRLFNAGLKFSPDNAQLHFLNGLTYHLLYLRGDEGKREYAVTGYELALNYDPAHFPAALQLGRLEFEGKRYGRAVEAFRHAIDVEPQQSEAYLGLAAAAYYAQDLASARTVVDQAATRWPESPEVARATALVYAASGNASRAGQAAQRYAVLEQRPEARQRVSSRVEQWRTWHAAVPARTGERAPEQLAQIYSPSSTSPAAAPPPAGEPKAGNDGRAWYDCGTSPAWSGSSGVGGGSSTTGDETTPLPSLPPPCRGAGSPRMTVLDVAFIRTENNASSSYGVNLLDGLSYVFNQSREVKDVVQRTSTAPENRTVTITSTRTRGLPSSGIAYSLNIANSTDARTEVLANPSLVALDRLPSTFFVGNNVTLGIAGNAGSASSVTDRPIGISLSVTPTFVDDETVLLAVKVARSFVEPVNQAVIFGHTLQTSRSAVTANVVMKMGQTLILSGLSEQEIQRNSDGVPILKDIPVLQYLFGTKMVQNFTRSTLVLITPRLPAYDGEVMARTVAHIDSLSGDKAQHRALIEKTMKASPNGPPGNLESTYRHSFGNKLFLQFRSGDLAIQHWSEPHRLETLFRSLAEVLYF